MALSTLDRGDCGGFPPDHSVEDHLASERLALAADLQATEAKAARDERWRLIRAAGLGIALAGTIAFGWSHVRDDSAPPRSCPADGFIAEDGSELHRDPQQACAWVDADGNPVPTDAEGRPSS